MKNKKLLTILTVAFMFSMLCTGCGKKKEDVMNDIIGTDTQVETNIFTNDDETNDLDMETTESEVTESETTESDTTESEEPSTSAKPTAKPTTKPTAKPSGSNATPTPKPSSSGSGSGNSGNSGNSGSTSTPKPTATPKATATPKPTAKPTAAPTAKPTQAPTAAPTQKPEISDNVANGDIIENPGYSDNSGCDHEFVDLGHYVTAPTCNNIGTGSAQCKKCGLKQSVVIPATGKHNYVVTGEVGEASCGDYKTVKYNCSGCGDYREEHVYDKNNHVEGGTCYDENGNCYGCGKHIHDVAPKPEPAPAPEPEESSESENTDAQAENTVVEDEDTDTTIE